MKKSFVEKLLNNFGFIRENRISRNIFVRGYQAAETSRLSMDWNSSSATADGEVHTALSTIRNRARDMAINNDYCKKYLNLLVQNVIGADGFVLQNKAKDLNGKFDNIANDRIENAFYLWGKKYASMDGKTNFNELCKIAIKSVARDGEIFIRIHRKKNLNEFGFSLQLIEADYLDEYRNGKNNNNTIRMGVEYDIYHKPVAYWFTKENDNTNLYASRISGEPIRIPAEEIIHLYRPDRINQTRGVSWLATSIYRLKMLHGYEEAALVNARASAAKMGFFKSTMGAEYTGDSKDTDGNVITDAKPGTFEELPPGMDFVPYDPKYPSDQHADFIKGELRGIASGLGCSYNTLANDLEGVNYSSIRAGLLDERENWKDIQQWFVDAFLEKVFSEWLDQTLLMGVLDLPYNKFDKFNQPWFIGRRWQWVDPMKDIEAEIIAIKNGLKTNMQSLSERGYDIYEVYEQLAAEKELQKKYGLNLGDNHESKNTPDDDEPNNNGNGNNRKLAKKLLRVEL